MMVAMEAEATSSSPARVSRGLSLPGRRRRRAAGERIAMLFEEHGRMVYGISRLLLRNPVEAEDAAQQTFLSAYRALLAGQEPRDPSAWLGTIARNECRARLRARQAEPLALVQEPAGEELQHAAARREEIQALCAALAELPPQQRDAVVLRELYGFSYAEVAAALGLSGAAVESLLFRGRKRLQEQLRPVRSALGMLTLPVTLRDSLGQALPGFGAAGASTGAGGAVLAKLASASVTTKIAAATLAFGTVGTVASVEHTRDARAPRVASARRAPARIHAHARRIARARSTVRAALPAAAQPVAAVTRVSPAAVAPIRSESGHDSSSRSGSGEVEREHRPAPAPASAAAPAPPPKTTGGGDRGGSDGGGGSDGRAITARDGSQDGSSGSGDQGATGPSSDGGSSGPGD